MIAISIKTYNRHDKLINCINSIYKYCDLDFKLYIADDSTNISDYIINYYNDLEKRGNKIIKYEDRVSVTKARNDIVDILGNEKYLLRLDDDFLFYDRTNIGIMVDILNDNPNIGAVSDIENEKKDNYNNICNNKSDSQGYLFNKNDNIYYLKIPVSYWIWNYSKSGYKYAIANFTRNFLLIKREVLNNTKWNESLYINGEHKAFMIDMQNNGWLLSFTPESEHIHDETEYNTIEYNVVRYSNKNKFIKNYVYKKEYNINKEYAYSLHQLIAPFAYYIGKIKKILR